MGDQYETQLAPQEEQAFQSWKQQYAPRDSGMDYDFRGAYKAGLTPAANGHWPDTFKKPNHPTFSDQSIYAKQRPDLAGHWNGDNYVPAGKQGSKIIEVPGTGNVEFPDTMSDDDIATAIRSHVSSPTPDQAAMAAGAKSPTASQMFKPTVQPKEEYIDPRAQVLLRMGEVLGHPENLPSALVENLRHPLESNIKQAVQTATTVATQPTKTSTASAAIGAALGLPVTAITQSAQKAGRTGEYGDLAGQFVQGALMGKGAGRAISEAVPVTEYPNTLPKVPDSTAAEAITNAVNPPPKQMPAFQKNVESQLPNIREEAESSNLPIKNRDALLSVVRNAAAKKRNFYYDSIIKPFEDVPKDVNQIPGYQGSQSQPGFATIGQLDKRLTQINAELYPKYQKGGMQSTAALNVQSDAALRAEAAAIRTVMNQELANRLNMTPEQVAQSRADFGQLGDLADKLELTLNKERFSANKRASAPPDMEVTTTGLVKAGAQNIIRKALGKRADRQVRKAF